MMIAAGPDGMAPAGAPSAVGDLIGRLFGGKRVTEKDLRAAAAEVAGIFGASRGPAPPGHYGPPGAGPGPQFPWGPSSGGEPPPGFYNPPAPGRRPPPPAQQTQADAEAAHRRAVAVACKRLGLNPSHLSKAVLNLRRRELAKKHHPDRKGGSLTKMQEINQAVDFLLETVDS